jgi:hypothetical protein
MKPNICRLFLLLSTTVLTLLVLGCGSNGSKPAVDGSNTEATITGKVLLKGKPATSGTVIFDPSNYLRKNEPARRTEIQKDGTYSIKTLTGSNSIRVEGKEVNALRGVDYAGLAHDVPAGNSVYDIKLPPEEADSAETQASPAESKSNP